MDVVYSLLFSPKELYKHIYYKLLHLKNQVHMILSFIKMIYF